MKSKPVKKQQHWGRGHYYEMGQLKEYVMQTEATIMDRLTYHRNNQAAVPKKLDLEFTFKLSEPEWKALDAIIQRLAAYEDTGLSPNEISHWIPINKRLPPLSDDNYDSRDYLVAVDINGKLKTLYMSYEKTQIRGKSVKRWKWNNRIASWKVVYWMFLPQSPGLLKEKNDDKK